MELILSAVLIVIAALHLLWAVGWWFPIRDETALARAVVGSRGITKMPGAVPCALVVAALLFVTSALWWPNGLLRGLILGGAAGVFLLRGAVAYMPTFRRLSPEEPFATLDLRYYGPVCLLIGAGLAIVLL